MASHGLFIELFLFVRRWVVNPAEMTVNIHRDVMKEDVTSASKDDRFIGYDLKKNDTSRKPIASKQQYSIQQH